ncbi:GEVED domain-containing protein [Deinococcus sp. KNUC1210]|uniref:beta strand repeat-containing protein n=1 Tax=Deinococcus sp. KNUC1210 TaxID=2917691 RepID=UPI001EF07CB6|nr:GEVED domain-containing protein [Deinococcus sp. KNUC1210]ULH14488.1 GEVED domain-containing protein [Deinococcus sp. KNUC1210]
MTASADTTNNVNSVYVSDPNATGTVKTVMSSRSGTFTTYSPAFTPSAIDGSATLVRATRQNGSSTTTVVPNPADLSKTLTLTDYNDPNCYTSSNVVGVSKTCSRGLLTFTFSRPVTNPVLHVAGVGGNYSVNNTGDAWGIANSYQLTTPGATMTMLGTPSNLAVTNSGTQLGVVSVRSGTSFIQPNCSSTNVVPAGCGSVQINGTYSTLTFAVSMTSTRAVSNTSQLVIPVGDDGTNTNTAITLVDAVDMAVSVDEDFGDAPATYDASNAASHIVSDLKLGSTITADNTTTVNGATIVASSPKAVAAGADNNGTNGDGSSDDAISTFPSLIAGATSYSLPVPISGASQAGQVCGWIDFNRNGTFDSATERACTAFVSGATSVTLNWTGVSAVTVGTNYVRLRASYDTSGVQSPTGRVDSGEVEDYRLTILAAPKLSLQKALPAGRVAATDQFTLGLTSSTSVTTTGTGSSVTSAAISNTNATVGTTYTFSETASGTTNLSNYTSTYACTNTLSGGQTPSGSGTSFTVTPVGGDNLTCTFTNTRKSATLTLKKTWAASSVAGDKVTLSTTGFTNNASTPVSTATVAGNTDTGTSVTVYVGESGTLAETFNVGSSANYTTTLVCSGNATALSGSTLTINPADTAITCTFTNTLIRSDLAIAKTGTTSTSVGSAASYTLTVWNIGPTAVASSTVADTVNTSLLSNVTWTCQAYGTASCGSTTSGSGNTISITTGALPVNNVATSPTSGDYLLFTVSGVATTAGTYTNTATVTAPSGTTDTVSSNNTSTVSNIVVSAASTTMPTPTCTLGSPVNLLAPTTASYYNNTINGFTRPTGASAYATGLADTDKQTYTQPVPLVTNSANYTVSAASGVGKRFVVDMRWSWSNGLNEVSGATTLTLNVNGTDYAVMTTSNGSSTVGSIAALNGAVISQTVVNATTTTGTYGLNPATRSYVVLPASVTAVSSASMKYNSTATGTTDDDVAYNFDSIYACPATLYIAKTSLGDVGTFAFSAFTNATPTTDSITTASVNTPVTSSTLHTITSAPGSTSVAVTETVTPGFTLTAATCSDQNGSSNANGSTTFGTLSGTVLTIPAANILATSNLLCTFTNSKTPTVTLKKLVSGGSGTNTFTFTLSGLNTTSDTAASVPVGTLTTANNGANTATVGTGVTLTEATGSTVPLSSYTTAISCTDSNSAVTGNTVALTSATTAINIPAANIKVGATYICTFTNTRKVTVLSLTKTSNGPWVAGQSGATYTLTPSNSAGDLASSGTITVVDTLPTGITPNWTGTLSINGWSCTFAGQTVTCTSAAVIAAGGTGTAIVLPVNVSGAAGTVTNYAAISGGGDTRTAPTPGASCTPTGMCASTSTVLTALNPDLSLVKTGAVLANPASPLTYSLVVTNLTSSAAANTVVTDTLPTGVTFVSASNSGTYSSGTNTVTWNLGTVAANATQTLTVTVTTPSVAAVGAGNKTLTNTATVAAPNDTNSTNNTGTATTNLILGTLSKTVQNVKTGSTVGTTGTGLPGDVLEYCIGFQNQGSVDLPSFQITDSVPSNVTALRTGGTSVNGYDTLANSAGFTGSGYGVKLTRGAVVSYLSSASDTDSGSLTGSGGTYSQGAMTVSLGTLAMGESGTACFRAVIK